MYELVLTRVSAEYAVSAAMADLKEAAKKIMPFEESSTKIVRVSLRRYIKLLLRSRPALKDCNTITVGPANHQDT